MYRKNKENVKTGAKSPSAQAMTQASLAWTHHYNLLSSYLLESKQYPEKIVNTFFCVCFFLYVNNIRYTLPRTDKNDLKADHTMANVWKHELEADFAPHIAASVCSTYTFEVWSFYLNTTHHGHFAYHSGRFTLANPKISNAFSPTFQSLSIYYQPNLWLSGLEHLASFWVVSGLS